MMTELVESKKNELLANSGLGATEDIQQSDLEIGRVSILQPLSELIQAEDSDYKPGQIVNISDGNVLGFKKEAFEFIPIGSYRYWIQKEGDKFVPGSKQPAISQDERPWEVDGIKNIYHHAFIVLNVADLKDGFALPYELSFRSTEVRMAKRLSSMLYKLGVTGKASWHKTFLMTTEQKTKDNYKWFGSNIAVGRDTTTEEINFAVEAREMFNLQKAAAMSSHVDEGKVNATEEEY